MFDNVCISSIFFLLHGHQLKCPYPQYRTRMKGIKSLEEKAQKEFIENTQHIKT